MNAKTKKRVVLKDPSFMKFMAQLPNMLPEPVLVREPESTKPYTKREMREDIEVMQTWQAVAMAFRAKAIELRDTDPRMSQDMERQCTKFTEKVTGLIERFNKNMERY